MPFHGTLFLALHLKIQGKSIRRIGICVPKKHKDLGPIPKAGVGSNDAAFLHTVGLNVLCLQVFLTDDA